MDLLSIDDLHSLHTISNRVNTLKTNSATRSFAQSQDPASIGRAAQESLEKKSGGTLPGTAATRRGKARLPGEGHRASGDARERNAEGLAPPGDERFGALVTRANRPGIARGSGTRRPWPSRRLGHGDSTHPGTMRGPPHTPLSRRRWEAERPGLIL